MKKYRRYIFLVLSIVLITITFIIGNSDTKTIASAFRSEEALCSEESGIDICKGNGGFCIVGNMPYAGIHYEK